MDEVTALESELLGERHRLIVEHLPLVRHIAGRMVAEFPGGCDREELESVGMLGLIGAADSWDASRGLKFSTYAFPKIRGAILDELRRLDFLPRGRRDKVRSLDRAVAYLEQKKGAPPSPEEIAEELGASLDEVDEILVTARLAGQASLDGGPSVELASMLSDPRSEDPVGSAEWEEMKELLVQAIAELPEQEQTVITLFYAEDLMLKDIAELLGVTPSRVSQIHSRAIYRLNCGLRSGLGCP